MVRPQAPTPVQGWVPRQGPAWARARVWVPLCLMGVLACGAWLLHRTSVPDTAGVPGGAREIGLIQAMPAVTQDPAGEAGPGGATAGGEPPSGPVAAQVLEVVAQRGRHARAAPPLTQSAESLQARVRQDPAAVHQQTAGQRLRLQGALASVESGEPGVLVLHLALADEPGTVRVVASPALAQAAQAWVPPKALSLDCLSQGVMMGEWLLVDCRE